LEIFKVLRLLSLKFIVLISFFVSAIQKLSFSNNNIRVLPDEIGACTTLEELYLSNNAKFNYFPSSAGHLRFVFQIPCFFFLLVIQFQAIERAFTKSMPGVKAVAQYCDGNGVVKRSRFESRQKTSLQDFTRSSRHTEITVL
jgi:Leucine-rich repeat (LRR) protein